MSHPQSLVTNNWQSQKPLPAIDNDGTLSPDDQRKEIFKLVPTQDEVRVLRECNTESFYYRCIPLSTLLSGLAYIAMKNGYLQKNPRFGYIPKMVLGGFLGFIGGKLSYHKACAEKIMRLPNSPMGELLRKKKGLPSIQESFATESGYASTAPDDLHREASLGLFDERQPDLSELNEGMDSYDKVTESLSPYSGTEEADKKSAQSYISYDDLRRDNRGEYINKLAEKYRRPPSDTGRSNSTAPSDNFNFQEQNPKLEPYFNPKKNKYGDIWEE